MKYFLFVPFLCLAACSWFAPRQGTLPDPTEIIVTGAAAGSILFVDGLQNGRAALPNDHPQVLKVPVGDHKVEIHVGDSVVYREDVYVAKGERRVVRVLSGLNR